MNNLLLLISISLSLYLVFKLESATRKSAFYVCTFSLIALIMYPYFFAVEEEDLLKILLGDPEKPYLSATNVLSRPFLLIGFALSRDFWVVAFETSIFFIILKSLKA